MLKSDWLMGYSIIILLSILLLIYMPLSRQSGMGRPSAKNLSQKTCHIKQTYFSFRVKGMRCKSRRTFIFLTLIFRKQSQQKFSVGQSVTIGIPEDVIVLASLLVYLLPIFGAVAGAALVGINGGGGDLQSIGGALAGLLLGGWLVSLHSQKSRNDLRYNPILVDVSAGSLSGNDTAIVQVR